MSALDIPIIMEALARYTALLGVVLFLFGIVLHYAAGK